MMESQSLNRSWENCHIKQVAAYHPHINSLLPWLSLIYFYKMWAMSTNSSIAITLPIKRLANTHDHHAPPQKNKHCQHIGNTVRADNETQSLIMWLLHNDWHKVPSPNLCLTAPKPVFVSINSQVNSPNWSQSCVDLRQGNRCRLANPVHDWACSTLKLLTDLQNHLAS